MDPILAMVGQFGLPGAVIGGLLVWLKRLQDKNDAEQAARLADAKAYAANLQSAADARLADAKGYAGQALELQGSVHRSVHKLSELVDLVAPGLPQPKRSSFHDGKE
jgi:hypothetical protein